MQLARRGEMVTVDLILQERDVLVEHRSLAQMKARPGQYLVTFEDGRQELYERDRLDREFETEGMEAEGTSKRMQRVEVIRGHGKFCYWHDKDAAIPQVVADSTRDPHNLRWAGELPQPNFDGRRRVLEMIVTEV